MKIAEETICAVCKKIFCCGKCREKHEIKVHAIVIKIPNGDFRETAKKIDETVDAVYVLCPICANKPFPLSELIYPEVLEHIKEHHLPLHCQKCDKLYTTVEELCEFSKCNKGKSPFEAENCAPALTLDENEHITADNKQVQLNTISTQTSPMLEVASSAPLSPISVINLRWYAKTNKINHENSDSLSSIKNLSIMSNISHRRSIGTSLQIDTKGQLVRTTSTPVQTETASAKSKEQNFNASGGQVSSIYNSGIETENEKNHFEIGTNQVMIQTQSENIYRKFGGRPKVAAVTPLRQVMSKSIQKAFAEQKKLTTAAESGTAFLNSPLDLRLSPALRRSQSDLFYGAKSEIANMKAVSSKFSKYAISSKKQTTNSIVITHFETSENASTNAHSSARSLSDSSVYKTCQSVEIITSTELSEINIADNELGASEINDKLGCLKTINIQKSPNNLGSIHTPNARLPGAVINKKLIKFETPNMKNESSKHDQFYTPIGSPLENNVEISKNINSETYIRREHNRNTPACRRSIRECAQSTAYSHYGIEYDSNDEVFLTPAQEKTKKPETSNQATQHGNGFIWSFMSSVMKKGTKLLDKKPSYEEDSKTKASIIKRCASIAGSLVRSNSLVDEKQLQSLKRKRTNTFDCPTSPLQPLRRLDSLPTHLDFFSSSKRFRIQGRKPIDRMRNCSSFS